MLPAAAAAKSLQLCPTLCFLPESFLKFPFNKLKKEFPQSERKAQTNGLNNERVKTLPPKIKNAPVALSV